MKKIRRKSHAEAELNTSSKRKNGGYSLVEVLVAVIIFVVVAIPLLRSFVTIAHLNAKSKKEQEATTVAQNLMEDIKVASISDLLGSARQEVDGSGNLVVDDAGNPVMEVDVVTNDADLGDYTIYYNKCKLNGNTYRAKVRLNAGAYKKAVGETVDLTNDISLVDVTTMSSETDAFFVPAADSDAEAARHFGNEAVVYPQMNRTIRLDINKNAADKTTVVATVEYEYNGMNYANVENVCIYANSAGTDLKNLYVFFNPMYTSTGGVAKEKIQINNNDNLKLNVFLVKQTDNSATVADEQKYKVDVDITENSRTEYFAGGEYEVRTDLQTNLDKSLNQMKLTYGGFNQMTLGSSYYSAEELVGVDTDTSLVKENKKDRLYSVEVSVYKLEDVTYGEALVTITGTKEE